MIHFKLEFDVKVNMNMGEEAAKKIIELIVSQLEEQFEFMDDVKAVPTLTILDA